MAFAFGGAGVQSKFESLKVKGRTISIEFCTSKIFNL